MTSPTTAAKEQLEFLWKIHAYTNDYIRFADQKAGVVLAVQSGLLAALYAAKAQQYLAISRLSASPTSAETVLGVCAAAAFAGLLFGIAFACAAISPRLFIDFRPSLVAKLHAQLVDNAMKGSIFWKQILHYKNKEDFKDAIVLLDDNGRVKEVAHHVFVLAGISNAKFEWIVLSVGAGVFGSIFGVTVLLAG